MSPKQQVREWLGGLWSDFWNVPRGRVLLASIIVIWIIIEAVWRISALTPGMRHSYHLFLPVRLGFLLLLLLRRGAFQ